MCIKDCALVQYRFYLAEDGLAPLVQDANAYLRKIGCDGEEVDEQQLKEALARFGETGGRAPIQSVENKCNADHALIVHRYYDTYILQLIANARSNIGWELLKNLRVDGGARGIGAVALFQGVYDASMRQDDVLGVCRNLASSLGIDAVSQKWCRLEAGYLVQLCDTIFALASPPGAQAATDDFVLKTFPRLLMYLVKARFQKEQYDRLIAWMNGKEIQPPPNLTLEEFNEWSRHRGVIPDLEVETNEAVAFVTENEAEMRIIGSREVQELMRRLQHLRLSYARLAKRETLSHEMLRHRGVVERTQAVLAALNEHAQELRDLQAQEEARLQSMQTSLIAAIASLIGVGQLFASIPAMMQWSTELKVWFSDTRLCRHLCVKPCSV